MYKREKGLIRDPFTCAAISKLVKKFQNTYSLHDALRNGRPSFVKKRERIIENAIESNKNDFGSCSTRLISQETGICKSSVHTIMRHYLLLYSYKIQLLQHITDDDKIRRQEFGIWLKQNEALVHSILWTDEAHFQLHGEINRHNCRIWVTVKVTETLSCSQHPAKLCFSIAFTSSYCLNFLMEPLYNELQGTMENSSLYGEFVIKRPSL